MRQSEKHRLRRVSLVFAIAAITARSVTVVSQEVATTATTHGAPTLTPNQGAEPAGDALNPQNLLQLFYQVQTSPGTTLNGGLDTVTKETFKLRGDLSVNLSSQWQIVFRGDLPYIAKNPISDSNPDGNTLYGLGDADIQTTIIHQFDNRWKAGAGVRLITPTGGETFGSGKWQVMPIAGFRYTLPEISSGSYFEPFVRYDVSFAGDPTRRNISNLQFAPMLNLALPDRWFLTFYPSADIRRNFGDPITGQTGRLFLPFDARIGRKFSDNFNVSVEVGVPIIRSYPVYKFMTALRFNLTF